MRRPNNSPAGSSTSRCLPLRGRPSVSRRCGVHVFVPDRFTWHRGALGALIGGVVVSPLVAFLVAFSAAWDRGSFQFVFNAGAWLAIAGGLGAGMVGRVAAWYREAVRERRHA